MNQGDLSAADRERLATVGWLVVPGVVESELLDLLSSQLNRALVMREEIRRRNGVEGRNDGTLHHLLGDHTSFIELLARLERFEPLMTWYFSGKYILNSYGGVINQRDSVAYVHQIHRDIRFSSDAKRFMLNVLVMLDDFTLVNGATHILSSSQLMQVKPDPDEFLRLSDRAIGDRGSVLFFDSRLWHATGHSQADVPRRALTLTFTSPFFKQQLDYPRLLGEEKAHALTPYLRQVIGFNARVPASLEEYYVPVAQRFYQRGQDD